tara:strand:+ start:1724 stop:2017 length:294 start_codon:yes stop_codon:yes gene_type:complete
MSDINKAKSGKGTIPTKGSAQWKTNEKLIASNPILRAARDTSEGFKPGSGISTGVNDQQFKDNYDKIKWSKKDPKEKPLFRTKVNGKYIDEDNEDNA